jgi:hypothetical protein
MTTTRHTLNTGVEVELERIEGEIIGFDETAITTIHQGDDFIVGQGFRPGNVSSGVATIKKAWVRLDDGTERQLDFTDLDAQGRTGHRLVMVFGAAVGQPKQLLAVHNATMKMLYSLRIGGGTSENNDLARRTWLPGVFGKEARMFAGVGAALLALILIKDGLIAGLVAGGIVGAILGSIAWVIALFFKLSPARRHEVATYREVEAMVEHMASA